MENRTFKPDYSKIKLRTILAIVIDIVLIIVALVLTMLAVNSGLTDQIPVINDIASLAEGCLLAHLIMSVVFTVIAFKNAIKSVTIEDDGICVNGVKYSNEFDPDNLRGLGINITGGIVQQIIPAAGVFFVFLSSKGKDRHVKNRVWTGPVRDKDAIKLRKDFQDFFKPYFDKVNDEHYEKVKETIVSKPMKATITPDKFHSAVVMLSILFGLAIFLMIYGALSTLDFLFAAVILLVGAAVMAFILIRFIINQNKCTKELLNELELSDTAVSVNGELYSLTDSEIDLYYISKKAEDIETSLRPVPPTKDTPMGMYVTLKDSEKSCRHWIGTQLDTESTAVVILLKFAKRLQEERNLFKS